MKPNPINRRVFLSTTARTGIALCGCCLCSPLAPLGAEQEGVDQPISLEGRCFCGYRCPEDCTFLRGTLEDDVELKKQAWKEWKIEQRFGVEFDPEQAICYGCRATDKPEGIVLANCTVRDCAIEKDRECCIDCDDLAGCEKDLWTRFPEFKKQVMAAQLRYRSQS